MQGGTAKERDEGKGLSAAAAGFSPACVAPPLPKDPEPGSALYRAVAERILAEIVKVTPVKQDVDTDAEEGGGGEGGGGGGDVDGGDIHNDARKKKLSL